MNEQDEQNEYDQGFMDGWMEAGRVIRQWAIYLLTGIAIGLLMGVGKD